MNEIRIVIVDDHPVFRKGVRALLEATPDLLVVGEAGTGADAIGIVQAVQPDIVIMDLMLPDMSGLAATEQIRAKMPAVRVLVLTSHAEADSLMPALRAGATGYVLKSETRLELINAVRAVASDQSLVPSEFTAQLVQAAVQPTTATAAALDDGLATLTAREIDTLKLIAHGLPNAQIATRLTIGEGTVKTHVSSILGKLHLTDRTQAALYAVKHQLIRIDEIEV